MTRATGFNPRKCELNFQSSTHTRNTLIRGDTTDRLQRAFSDPLLCDSRVRLRKNAAARLAGVCEREKGNKGGLKD